MLAWLSSQITAPVHIGAVSRYNTRMQINPATVMAARQELARRGEYPASVSLPDKLKTVFSGRARYRGAHGGRGSGKTRGFALMSAVRGDIFATMGVIGTILCGREFQNSLEDSSFSEVRAAIQSDPYLRTRWEIGRQFIRHVSGRVEYTFSGLRHNIESIKGKARILIAWVDEAEQVSEMSWRTLIPTVREQQSPEEAARGVFWSSEIWLTWNPGSEKSATNQRFNINATDDMKIVKMNWSDNPWFPEVLNDERKRDLAARPADYAHIWEGEYRSRSDAMVFSNWKMREFVAPPNAVFRFGADWGFSIDPTVLVRGYLDGRTLYVDYEAYAVGCEVDKTPALFDQVPKSREYRITADSARPEVVSYMRRNGFPKIVPAVKGKGSIEDGISFLQSFDIVVHPRCENVAREMASFSYKIDRMTEEVLPVLDDKDNHTIDALRYALEGLRRAGKPVVEATDKPPIDRYAKLRDRYQPDDGNFY